MGSATRVGVWWAAVVAAASVAGDAQGFYFRGWPAGPKEPPTLNAPQPPTPEVEPHLPGTTEPPTVTPPPGGGEPPDEPGGPGGPNPTTPEPGTLALAVLGLGGVAGFRRQRKPRG
jgi:hypothetical protein